MTSIIVALAAALGVLAGYFTCWWRVRGLLDRLDAACTAIPDPQHRRAVLRQYVADARRIVFHARRAA